jgi:uncharacterized protein (DUF1778 family)
VRVVIYLRLLPELKLMIEEAAYIQNKSVNQYIVELMEKEMIAYEKVFSPHTSVLRSGNK